MLWAQPNAGPQSFAGKARRQGGGSAAVEITGEALSEYGLRRGNLVSCRARIELKARDAASGDLITVERQTSVGVDIAEHIAAKTALQNGADALAERVLPKLGK